MALSKESGRFSPTEVGKISECFKESLMRLGSPMTGNLGYDFWSAPHQPAAKPKDSAAVYVFALSDNAGNCCQAGPGRVLKVGKAGVNSNARFQSQHYGFSAPSTVAKALFYNPILWPYLGIDTLQKGAAGEWLKNNTDRHNFFLYDVDIKLLTYLEIFLKATLSPAFEGVQTRELA